MEFLLDIAKVKKKFANTMATNKKKVSKVKKSWISHYFTEKCFGRKK